MNFISLTRKEFMSWQPFATSTPLKTIPNNIKSTNIPSKELLKPSDAINVLLNGDINTSKNHQLKTANEKNPPQSDKKVKRNRSSFFFDVTSSSSSEDEDLDNNNPVLEIKIQSKNTTKTKSILKNKNYQSNEENKQLKNSDSKNVGNENKNIKKTTRNIKRSSLMKLKNKTYDEKLKEIETDRKQSRSCNDEKKKQTNFKDNSITRNKINNLNILLKPKENNCCDVLEESHCVQSNQNNDSVKKTKNFPASNTSENSTKTNTNDLVNKKSVVKDTTIDEQKSKIPLLKQLSNKRKACKGLDAVSPAKKVKKRTKISIKEKNNIKKIQNPIVAHIKEDSKNLSHQLFSDSAEQELINSLDLTKEDVEEPIPCKKPLTKVMPKKSLSTNQLKTQQSTKPPVKKSSRLQQPPKKFWLSESSDSDCRVVTENLITKEILKSNDNNLTESEGVSVKENKEKIELCKNIENKIEECIIKNEKIIDKEYNEKIEKDIVVESNTDDKAIFKVPVAEIKRKSCRTVAQKRQSRQLRSNTKSIKLENENKKLKVEGPELKQVSSDLSENVNSKDAVLPAQDLSKYSDPVFFKSLNELQFLQGNQPGYFTSKCWSLKNFKCGILKVQEGSYVDSNTAFDNSYFGGVLVKGCLKMKIGSKELSLQEGDMAYVPPLTEWSMFNISKTDVVFYYWCGRFKN